MPFSPPQRAVLPVAVVAALVLAGCTAGSPGPAATVTTTTTGSPSSAKTITPVSEAPIPPPGPVTESPIGACPYITSDDARNAEGDRVGRVTLTSTTPPGCNFYFQYDASRMIAQITVDNYPSQDGARNAMIRTADASAYPALSDGMKDFAPGVDAVWYKTSFYPPDGDTDWACAFAKDSRVITVRTQQNDTSQNARNFAALIVAKF